jgi:hypothetical protein
MSPTHAIIAGTIGLQCIAAAIVVHDRIGDVISAVLGLV